MAVIYWIKPWKPRIGIYRNSLKGLLKFGVPFQVNDLLARIKDDLLFVVVKKYVSIAEIGYLGWAKRWSLFPFRFSVDSIVRVTFPAYSRMQSDMIRLGASIEKAMFFISLVIFPLLAGMAVMAWPVTVVIEEYRKWQPALPSLYLFIFDVGIASLVVPLTNALNAVGKVKTTLKLMSFWTALIWILAIPMTIKFGFIGVAMATAGVSVSTLITVLVVKKVVEIRVLKNVVWQLVAAGVMAVILLNMRAFGTQSVVNFTLTVVAGGLIYLVLVFVLMRSRLTLEVRKLLESKALVSK